MTPQERDQLQHFLKQLSDAKAANKDAEAEQLIQQAIAHQPDASYLLVQRVLLQEQALNNAKQQISELQRQLQANQNQSSFLGNDPWAQAAAAPAASNYQPPRYVQTPPPLQSGSFSGAPSFLGNVATTAAGVVAGSFLFQGIENLLGQHNHGNGWQQTPTGLGENITEQTVINNYYGDDGFSTADYQPDTSNFSSPDSNPIDDSDLDSDWI